MRMNSALVGRVCLFASALFLVVPPTALRAQEADAAAEIHAILDRFEECFLEEDVDGIADMLAEEYMLAVDARGEPGGARLLDRASYISGQRHKFGVVDYIEHAHVDREIEIHGPMATSRSTVVDRQASGDSGRARMFHVYARIDGTWMVVFTSSRLAGP
jgi:hypothetical protein